MKAIQWIVLFLLSAMGTSMVHAQGIRVYKKDGTQLALPYNEVDSLVVYDYIGSGDFVEHDYIDLGLSVVWATCNIGASSPSDYGDYFAWGEVVPKEEYTSSNSITLGVMMGDIGGNPQYDAARANWGGSWRLPTRNECKELVDNCIWTWITMNGKSGYKIIGPNGNSIFLPAAGILHGKSLIKDEVRGHYWGATPEENDSNNRRACGLDFDGANYYEGLNTRLYGRSVRPVSVHAQGIRVYKKDGMLLNFPPYKVDSLVAYNHADNGDLSGHEYFDLGLSVKWATCNVGASSPSDYGDYFAWGEIVPKSEYTKDNSVTYGKTIGDISGSPLYDAARANWGGSWRLPTQSELQELLDECTWTWVPMDGKMCYKVTGPNGNSIFLPATGWRLGKSLYTAGERGYYWGATPFESNTNYACGLLIGSGTYYMGWGDRSNGRSVRPVSE